MVSLRLIRQNLFKRSPQIWLRFVCFFKKCLFNCHFNDFTKSERANEFGFERFQNLNGLEKSIKTVQGVSGFSKVARIARATLNGGLAWARPLNGFKYR